MDEIYERVNTNFILKKKIGELLSVLKSYLKVIEDPNRSAYLIYRLYHPFINKYRECLGEVLSDPLYQYSCEMGRHSKNEIKVYEDFVDGVKSFLRWKIILRKSREMENENVLEMVTSMNESIFNNNNHSNKIRWPKIGENSNKAEMDLLKMIEDMIIEMPNTDRLIHRLCEELPLGRDWCWKTMFYTVDNMIYLRDDLSQGEKKSSVINLLSAMKILCKGNGCVMSHIKILIDDFSDFSLKIDEGIVLDQIWCERPMDVIN